MKVETIVLIVGTIVSFAIGLVPGICFLILALNYKLAMGVIKWQKEDLLRKVKWKIYKIEF